MRIFKCLFLLICLSLILINSDLQAYNLRQISNMNGLSNSAILSICQDNEGFMWFGTCDGLNMYDGSNIQIFKPSNDKNNLSGNLIHSILEAQNDIFWIATNYGLNRFDRKKNIIDHYNDFSGKILMAKDTKNHVLVIKEDNAIYYYHSNSNSLKKIAVPGLIYNDILDVHIDSDNNLWIFSKNGSFRNFVVSETNKGDIHLEPRRTVEHSAGIRFCFHEKNSIYFIDDDYILFEFDVISNKKYYRHNLDEIIRENGEVSSIIKHHNDYFIAFLTNGLVRLKNITEKKENYLLEEIDVRSGIFTLYNDKNQDIIWIGTDCQGVYLYFNDPYQIRSTTFNNVSYEVEKPIRTLLLDRENTLWIGTKGDGILKVNDYNFDKPITNDMLEHISSANSSLKDNSVYTFAKSRRDIIWIGNDNGLDYYSFKERKIKNVTITDNPDLLKYIHAILEVNDSILYMASVGMGIFKARVTESAKSIHLNKIEQVVIKDSSMSANYFFTIYQANISSILFGNRGNGIIKMDPKTMHYSIIQPGQNQNNQLLNDVFSISCDKLGNIWCGTSFGLAKLSPDQTIEIFNEMNGFPNNTIHGILEDSEDNLWLSTNRGMIKFNTKRAEFQNYNQLNGLMVTEFSDGAFYKDEKGKTLFFGGINGFIAIKQTNLLHKEYLPSIFVDNLTIFGEAFNIYDFMIQTPEQNILKLNHKQNFFSISFKTNDYINNNNYSYYYKLDGVNANWINNNASNVISFTNIVHGNYTLLIKFRNRVTGIESQPFVLEIKIAPPWYTTKLAYILYVLLIIASIGLIVKYSVSINKKKRITILERIKQKHQEEIHESKLRFFTNIAHEFFTPLTLISGPCNRILSYNNSDSFVKKHTRLIQQNANRLNDLIQELVEFRRIETGNREAYIEPLQVNDEIVNITDSFLELAESKGINYRCNIESLLEWNTDKKFLTIIVTNLVSNAFKYVETQGKIDVTVVPEKDNQFLTIQVSNTGKGIQKKDIENIFDRYRILDNFENQDDNSYSVRNGLGMAITHNLVRLLNGSIDVLSTPGAWTKFIVKLPKTKVTLAENKVLQKPTNISGSNNSENIVSIPVFEYDESKQTVLIIDDETDILSFIGDIVSPVYNVICVNKPIDVEEILKQTYPDIILCDIMMPEIDGITLTKRIKSNKKTAHIPMILISAKQNVEEKIKGLNAGAEMYLTKPFDVDFLKASVEGLILRKEALKNYFNSPMSAFDMTNGKIEHKEDKKFIREMHNIINSNLTRKDLSAKYIASEMNMSTRHLYRRLEKLDADSPQKIIKENRLYVAKNLLITTKLTIDEILYKSGFSNRSSFFKTFHERYDCTPKEFRDMNYKEIVAENKHSQDSIK